MEIELITVECECGGELIPIASLTDFELYRCDACGEVIKVYTTDLNFLETQSL